MDQGFTLWLTGLPASGKTAIAARVEESLLERGLNVERIDEGEVREAWLPTLGRAQTEEENLARLLGHVCHLLTRNGVIAIAAAVSPSREIRNEIRSRIGRFAEVFVQCPAEICAKRDAAGRYEKARRGELPGFVGVGSSYEEPVNPEILLTADRDDLEKCARKAVRTLELLDWIPRVAGSDYNEAEEETITQRLKDLGYI
jgi:adenylylsulfate kinase